MQALGFVWRNAPRRRFNLVHREEIVRHASHGGAIALLEAWSRLRSRGGMVLGRDFPTRAFAGLLSDAILFEKRADRGEFRVRLAGFAMQCFHGFDITGKMLPDFCRKRKTGGIGPVLTPYCAAESQVSCWRRRAVPARRF